MKKYRYAPFFIVLFLLYGCVQKQNFEGDFYDTNSLEIVSFEKGQFRTYSLADSTKTTFEFWTRNNNIFFKSKNNNSYELTFEVKGDTLFLHEKKPSFLKKKKSAFLKLNIDKSSKTKDLYNKYWKSVSAGDYDNIIFNISDSSNSADVYIEVKDGPIIKEISNPAKIHVNKLSFFNRFNLLHFQDSYFSASPYLVEDIKSDTLTLLDIKKARRYKFYLIESQQNQLIYGHWETTNSAKDGLFLVEKGALFYFGDQLSITKENKIYVLSNPMRDDILPINFDFGLHSQYLVLRKFDYNQLKIIRLTQDSLVFENPFMRDNKGGLLLMKYIRIEGADNLK